MDHTLSQAFDWLGAALSAQFLQAAMTLGGMIIEVLGVFALIDAIRFPAELVRTGKRHPSIYDQTIAAYGAPWEPVWQRPLSRWFRGITSALLAAGAFAIIIGVGYRRGEIGAFVGAAFGLGLGAAVALRPANNWIVRLPVLSQIIVLLRNVTWIVCFVSATVILFVLELLFGFLLFALVTAVWLVLLPWLLFAWAVRAMHKRPSHSGALILPILFLSGLPSTVSRERQTASATWRNPANYSISARFTRWVVGQSAYLERFVLGVIIGTVCSYAGQSLIASTLGIKLAAELWILLSSVFALGLVLERIFEFVVESLYYHDLTGFIDYGPGILAGLRVGLLTELSLGTIVGLVTSNSSLVHTVFDALQVVTPANLLLALTPGSFAVALVILPDTLGWIAAAVTEWLNLRLHSIRSGSAVAGLLFVVLGTALQLLQFAISAH